MNCYPSMVEGKTSRIRDLGQVTQDSNKIWKNDLQQKKKSQ